VVQSTFALCRVYMSTLWPVYRSCRSIVTCLENVQSLCRCNTDDETMLERIASTCRLSKCNYHRKRVGWAIDLFFTTSGNYFLFLISIFPSNDLGNKRAKSNSNDRGRIADIWGAIGRWIDLEKMKLNWSDYSQSSFNDLFLDWVASWLHWQSGGEKSVWPKARN
jgi:hypothetical protein